MTYCLNETEGGDELCPDSYCPMKTLHLKLGVIYEAQHDGRSWSKDFVEECESNLIEKIIEDLKPRIELFVRKTKPYDCHVFD